MMLVSLNSLSEKYLTYICFSGDKKSALKLLGKPPLAIQPILTKCLLSDIKVGSGREGGG